MVIEQSLAKRDIMIDDKGGEGGLKITKKVWHNILTVPNTMNLYWVNNGLD